MHLLLDAQNVEKQIESYFAFKDFESKKFILSCHRDILFEYHRVVVPIC